MRRAFHKIRNTLATPLLKLLLVKRRLLSRAIRAISARVNNYDAPVFEGLQPSDIALSQADHMDRIKSQVPASFSEMMNYRTKKKKLTERKLPEWELNNKTRGAQLARVCGVRVPKVYQQGVALEDIEWRDGVTVKPIPGAGSEGVYCYFNEESIWGVLGAQYLSSRDELLDSLHSYSQRVDSDKWLVEELIVTPEGALPRDLKFYAFYGRIGLVLEVQKQPQKRYCFWDAKGAHIDTGKYPRDKLFHGEGFAPESLEVAQNLSQEIPAPFIRIDFLDNGEELVFGEFTPRPGGFGLMNRSVDAELGREFIAAETRLFNDLIDGKRFSNYTQVVGAATDT